MIEQAVDKKRDRIWETKSNLLSKKVGGVISVEY